MRFDEGDVIEVRDRKYRIDQVSMSHDGTVLHYCLKPVGHDLPATLKPHNEALTLREYHDVTGDVEVVDVKDGDDS